VLIPVYGFLQGDVLGLVVLVHDHETVADLAEKLMQAAATRVQPFAGREVHYKGQKLSPTSTIANTGIEPLDRGDVKCVTNGSHANASSAVGASSD
jgi:hypothetical protein